MKINFTKIWTFILILTLISRSAMAQITTFPWVENFSTSTAWTFINGSATNKWNIGSGAGNPANGLYVSNDDGVTNAFTNTASSVVHAYATVSIPAGGVAISFSFDWKGVAESCCDYLRVWVVPSTYTPTTGSLITTAADRLQLGGNFNSQSTWKRESFVLPTSYAGTSKKIIFEWRNDGSLGDNPPAAVDNINLSVSSCQQPTALTVTTIGSTTASLGWTEPASATLWRVEYGPAGFTPGTGTSVLTSTNPCPVSGLTANTSYDFYVRSLCTSDSSALSGPRNFFTAQIPASIPYSENWDGTNQWTIINGSQTNKWHVGTATGNPAKSIYISNNVGVANAYTTTSSSIVHAYRDIAFPVGLVEATFSFDWKNSGESGWDYLRAWIVPVTYTPTAGTNITTAASGGVKYGIDFNSSSTWTNQNYILPASYAGQTMRVVFEWTNDGSAGTQPPAAVDNINIIGSTCARPTAVTVIDIDSNEATLRWTDMGTATQWSIEYGPAGFTPGTGSFSTVSDTTVTLSDLTPNTSYDFYVRSKCGATDSSARVGPINFLTNQIPASIPYEEEWNDDIDWTIINGSQVNKWHIGSATGNPANSAYISNTGGSTNAYNINSSSVVHIYRDVNFPVGTTAMNLSFDWKNDGEDDYDYLRVWVTPLSFKPTAGVALTTSNGTRYGGNFQNFTTWKAESFSLPASYAGQTLRFVFEWTNDGSVGTQPPAAIDNINITGNVPCPAPTSVAITDMTTTTATISWSSVTVPSSWEINYGPTGFPVGSGTTVTASSSPHTITDLIPSTSYQFYVRSNCSFWGTNSGWIGPVSGTTDCILPEILSLIPDTICGPGVTTNTATASLGASVEWYASIDATTALYTGSTFITPELTASTTYYAAAVLSEVCIGEREEFTVVVNDLPVADLGSDTSICDLTSIVLSTPVMSGYQFLWNTGENTSSIEVEEGGNYKVTVTDANNCVASDDINLTILPLPSVDGFNFVPLFETGTRAVRFEPLYAMHVDSYYWDFGDGTTSTEANPTHEFGLDAAYGVTLVVSNGCGSDTASLDINVDLTTGVNQLGNNAALIQLYPNPSQNIVTISNNKNIKMQGVTVYNTLGAVIFRGDAQGNATYKLSVADFASGMYTVMIQTEQGAVIRKIQVVH